VKTEQDHPQKIGVIAEAAGVSIQTVRYYERLELISEPARTEGGFRLYPPSTVRRVRFIKKAQTLGFSLDEIRDLLELDDRPTTTCRDVRKRLDAKVATVDEMIRNLTKLKAALLSLATRCPGDATAKNACPLLDSLISDGT
jgi:MerR family transcriptional regulator, copper efflux regulator